MISVNGTYDNGVIRLDTMIKATRTLKVIVTFIEEDVQTQPQRLSAKDFSFTKAREKSKRYKGSLADAIIEERKAAL